MSFLSWLDRLVEWLALLVVQLSSALSRYLEGESREHAYCHFREFVLFSFLIFGLGANKP